MTDEQLQDTAAQHLFHAHMCLINNDIKNAYLATRAAFSSMQELENRRLGIASPNPLSQIQPLEL
jgi:hypothetical protein